MTFSLLGRCPRSGSFGVVVTSSSPCVASRCAWVRAASGAVATQNITNPALGELGLALLSRGIDATRVRDMLVQADPYPEYRQITVLGAQGPGAGHSGTRTLGTFAAARQEDCVAAGNILASPRVPQAMCDAFSASPDEELALRLLAALEAGERAGGEEGPVRSAGLMVADSLVWPSVDLRVDWHDAPIAELRRVWKVYAPQAADYRQRALNPTLAPTFGVPGDP